MCAAKMHDDEVETDASLVRRLLAAQFPQWADLPIVRPVARRATRARSNDQQPAECSVASVRYYRSALAPDDSNARWSIMVSPMCWTCATRP